MDVGAELFAGGCPGRSKRIAPWGVNPVANSLCFGAAVGIFFARLDAEAQDVNRWDEAAASLGFYIAAADVLDGFDAGFEAGELGGVGEVAGDDGEAASIRSSLGPKGMDKMLADSFGDVTITSDGRTILG